MSKNNCKKLRIIPLGGIGEIGKNLTVFEYDNDIIVIDCGLMFPSDEMLGIDYVIPDITYLEKNRNKIRAFFITHGHEDHIGGIPYIASKFNAPVYGTGLTIALIESKMLEYEESDFKLITVKAGTVIDAGCFSVEFIRVCHSIDDAVGFAIKTPAGMVVFTGDFKIDLTPVGGKVIDLSRFAELGKKGVLALLSDSTNAVREGFNETESSLGDVFIEYFKLAKGRIIVSTFSSNVHRLQQVIDAAKVYNKKVCFFGRSMKKILNVSKELGLLKIADEMIIDINDLNNYKDSQIVVLSTGSQGETMSGLFQMVMGHNSKITIKPNDLVILSATPIPGNEKYVYNIVNMIYRHGASVINDVHVSGHACADELKLMLSLVHPKFFIPVHGEYRHLYNHAALAEKLGIFKKNIFIAENGSVIELSKLNGRISESVPAGEILVDGLGVGDVGEIVLKDRQQLGTNGLFMILIVVDKESCKMISSPDIISRGFVYMRESEDLIVDAKKIVADAIDYCLSNNIRDYSNIKNIIRKDLSKYLYGKTERNPMILTVIKEI